MPMQLFIEDFNDVNLVQKLRMVSSVRLLMSDDGSPTDTKNYLLEVQIPDLLQDDFHFQRKNSRETCLPFLSVTNLYLFSISTLSLIFFIFDISKDVGAALQCGKRGRGARVARRCAVTSL